MKLSSGFHSLAGCGPSVTCPEPSRQSRVERGIVGGRIAETGPTPYQVLPRPRGTRRTMRMLPASPPSPSMPGA